jgi:hypothetical protein
VNQVKTHIGDEEIDALRCVVGNNIVVSITNGRARENGIFFDEALIEYWPPTAERRMKSNLALPVSGTIEDNGDGCWIAFAISQSIEVSGVEKTLSNGRATPKPFHMLISSKKVRSLKKAVRSPATRASKFISRTGSLSTSRQVRSAGDLSRSAVDFVVLGAPVDRFA